MKVEKPTIGRVFTVAAVLVFVATSARADHIWRLWCGTPPASRTGTFDTGRECWERAEDTELEDTCVDTKGGPRAWGHRRVPSWDDDGLRTCAEVRRDRGHCYCEPEAVPEK